jgi:RNA polymerase sigma-70 factor (ECF subfamily)
VASCLREEKPSAIPFLLHCGICPGNILAAVRRWFGGRRRMSDTPVSLLERLTNRPDEEAWRRFIDLYTPYILGWLRRDPSLHNDADDLVQEVLAVVHRELPRFQRLRSGSFRAWLRIITANRLHAFWKSRRAGPAAVDGLAGHELLSQLADHGSELSQRWDREHDLYIVRRLVEQVAADFEPATLQAFRLVTLEGRKAIEAAAELKMSRNAVLLAKSRVLQRLRELSNGFID